MVLRFSRFLVLYHTVLFSLSLSVKEEQVEGFLLSQMCLVLVFFFLSRKICFASTYVPNKKFVCVWRWSARLITIKQRGNVG